MVTLVVEVSFVTFIVNFVHGVVVLFVCAVHVMKHVR